MVSTRLCCFVTQLIGTGYSNAVSVPLYTVAWEHLQNRTVAAANAPGEFT